MKFIFFLISLVSITAFAETITCVTEVRHFCNEFEPCVKNIDENKSIHSVQIFSKKVIVTKIIAGVQTSKWEAKLVNKKYDGANTYLENGGALTLFTLNSNKRRFLLLMPGSDITSTWSQVEIGKCE